MLPLRDLSMTDPHHFRQVKVITLILISPQVVPATVFDYHGGLDVDLHLPDERPRGHLEISPGNEE